jgi:hypothetical protein
MSSVAVYQTMGSRPGWRLANSGRSRTSRILLLMEPELRSLIGALMSVSASFAHLRFPLLS